jgi:ATP-dependent DNA ligase
MPRVESRLLVLDAIHARGERLFELACERDLEGIVAKWANGTYQCDGRGTSWLKIKNPAYSQIEGRRELFAAKRDEWRPPRTKAAPLALALV